VDGQVGPVAAKLGLATDGGRADPRARREVSQRRESRGRREHEAVPDVLTGQVGGEDQATGQGHVSGHVLHAVDGGVDPAHEQRPVDLLDEQALASEGGQVPRPLIGTGIDAADGHVQARDQCGE
jgi:hypothetical protein